MTHLSSTKEYIVDDLVSRIGFAMSEWVAFAPHALEEMSEIEREAYVYQALSKILMKTSTLRQATEEYKRNSINKISK